jgi:methyl-accepting chemotaxis protein
MFRIHIRQLADHMIHLIVNPSCPQHRTPVNELVERLDNHPVRPLQSQVKALYDQVTQIADVVEHIQSHQTEVNEVRDKVVEVGEVCETMHEDVRDIWSSVKSVEEDTAEILEILGWVKDCLRIIEIVSIGILLLVLLYRGHLLVRSTPRIWHYLAL